MLRTLVITCVICPSSVLAFPFALSVQMPCIYTVDPHFTMLGLPCFVFIRAEQYQLYVVLDARKSA